MASYIGNKLGVKVELVVTSANRIPTCRPKRLTWGSDPRQEPEREKVIDFTAAYSPVLPPCLGRRT